VVDSLLVPLNTGRWRPLTTQSNDTNDLVELDLEEDVIALYVGDDDVIALNVWEEALDSDDEDEPAESYRV